jgi:hypothetical protein
MGILSRYKQNLKTAESAYSSIGEVQCPYFNSTVRFNSEGFHHLRYKTPGSERDKKAQMHKFRLISAAKIVISKSGTVQEYRKQWGAVGRKRKSDGSRSMKEMQYWGFVAIVGEATDKIRIRAIVRQVGNGNPHFWSVMSDTNLRKKASYTLAHDSILDG